MVSDTRVTFRTPPSGLSRGSSSGLAIDDDRLLRAPSSGTSS